MQESSGASQRKEVSEVRLLIEGIKGQINLILSKVDNLTDGISKLQSTTVTREEITLILEPLQNKVSGLEDFRNKVYTVVGMLALSIVAYTVAHAIPGLNL